MTTPAFASPHADPWAAELVDLPSLHAGVSEAIFEVVHGVRAAAGEGRGQPAQTLLVLGAAGAGKTHLFTRLRRRLGPRALLVHVRPPASSEITPRLLVGEILEQLGYESFGVRQVDALVGGTLARCLGEPPEFPRVCLDQLQQLPAAAREERIETAIERLLERHQRLDESYLRRLLSVPFATAREARALLAWLGGRELDPVQAARIGAHEELGDERLVSALRTLTVIAAPASPLLLVFDQLENLIDPRGDGHLVHAYGNLVAELVDAVGDLVVAQMVIDTEWSRGLLPHLSAAQRTRVEGRRLTLGLPSPEEASALLELWHGRIAHADGPFPWPFTTDQLRALVSHPGITPRMLLLELRRALDGEPAVLAATAGIGGTVSARGPEEEAEDLGACIAAEWAAHLAAARAHIDRRAGEDQGLDPSSLFDGIGILTRIVPGLGELEVLDSRTARLGVGERTRTLGLVLQAHHVSAAAALSRLARIKGPVLGMRERWREFRPTWRVVRQRQEELRSRADARWLWLDREDAARLVALATLGRDVRAQDVSDPLGRPVSAEVVEAWLHETVLPGEWAVARVLRGEPGPAGEDLDEGPRDGGAAEPARVVRDDGIAPRPRATEASGGAGSERPSTPLGGGDAQPGHLRAEGVMPTLERLRVVSLERLQRELASTSPGVTRAALVAELQRHAGRVAWLGDAILVLRERADR